MRDNILSTGTSFCHPLLHLACADIRATELLDFLSSLVLLISFLSLPVVSCIYIISTVLRTSMELRSTLPRKDDELQGLTSGCVSHASPLEVKI
ncbi:hypothetical protein H8959_018214 [Pygathrix nigripes]